ncbi:hypothetical protein OPQ81_003837 [Rhizoctonia solani]|nr:hypothetical protein OPQ81_003837 [Rhizoctonia solani]
MEGAWLYDDYGCNGGCRLIDSGPLPVVKSVTFVTAINLNRALTNPSLQLPLSVSSYSLLNQLGNTTAKTEIHAHRYRRRLYHAGLYPGAPWEGEPPDCLSSCSLPAPIAEKRPKISLVKLGPNLHFLPFVTRLAQPLPL